MTTMTVMSRSIAVLTFVFSLCSLLRCIVSASWDEEPTDLSGNATDSFFFGKSVAASPDGSHLLVGGALSLILYQNEDGASSWSKVEDFTCYFESSLRSPEDIRSLVFSSDGRHFAAAEGGTRVFAKALVFSRSDNSDGTTTWSSKGGPIIGTAVLYGAYNLYWFKDYGNDLALSDDGVTLAVANQLSNHVQIYKYSPPLLSVDLGILTWPCRGWSKRTVARYGNARIRFGRSIAMDGAATTLVVGADWDAGANSEIDAGSVSVYDLETGERTLIEYGDAASDLFGDKVILSNDGSRLAATALGGGYVRLYNRAADGTYVASSTTATTAPPTSIALSADGSRLVVGSYWNGEVVVYEVGSSDEGSTLTMSATLKGRGDTTEKFGFATSLAADGGTLIVGVPHSVENRDGYARVFVTSSSK